MVEENFVLKWKNHTEQMRKSLHQMMMTESVTDVTLVSSDQLYFKAHKVVIGAGSSIFNDIVNKTHVNDTFIFMRGVTGNDLKSILSFVYLGEVSIDHERMNEFLEIARDLGIKGLSANTRESETNAKQFENSNRRTNVDIDINEKVTELESSANEVMKEEDIAIDENVEEGVKRNSHDSNGDKGHEDRNNSLSDNGSNNGHGDSISTDEKKPDSRSPDLPRRARGRSHEKLSGPSKESKCVSPTR